MRYNVFAHAFGRDVTAVPDAELPIPPPTGQQTYSDKLFRRFLEEVPQAAPGTEEAFLLAEHQQFTLDRYEQRKFQHKQAHLIAFFLSLPIDSVLAMGTLAEREIDLLITMTEPMPAEINALALLAVRNARHGIAESPNNADGYFVLADVYRSPAWHGLPEETRELVVGASLGRFYTRLSPEQQAVPTDLLAQQAAHMIFQSHFQQGRIDLANEFFRRWLAGIQAGPRPVRFSEVQFLGQLLGQLRPGQRLSLTTEAEVNDGLKALDPFIRRLDQTARDKENVWLNNTARLQSQFQRAAAAQKEGLYRKSLQELNAIDTSESSKLPREEIYSVLFARIRLNMLVGQAEEADEIIRVIDDGLQRQLQNQQRTDFDDPKFQELRSVYNRLKRDVMLVLGRFSEVVRALNADATELDSSLDRLRQVSMRLKLHSKETPIGMREIVALGLAYKLSNRPGATFTSLIPMPGVVPYELLFNELAYNQYPQVFRGLEEIHFRLGMTYLEQGNNPAAAAQFREVIRSATPIFVTQQQRTAQFMLDMMKMK